MLDTPINEFHVDVTGITFPFSFAVLVPGAQEEVAKDTMQEIILAWRKNTEEGNVDMHCTPLLINGVQYDSADEPFAEKNLGNVYVYHFSFSQCRNACFDIEVKAENKFTAEIKLINQITKWRDIVDFQFARRTVLTPIKWEVESPYDKLVESLLSIEKTVELTNSNKDPGMITVAEE